MNTKRRKAIDELITKFNDLQSSLEELTAVGEELKSEIETLRDEEQEYYDNMPESLQNGEKGDAASAAIEKLEEALSCEVFDEISSAASNIGEVISALEEAKGA